MGACVLKCFLYNPKTLNRSFILVTAVDLGAGMLDTRDGRADRVRTVKGIYAKLPCPQSECGKLIKLLL